MGKSRRGRGDNKEIGFVEWLESEDKGCRGNPG